MRRDALDIIALESALNFAAEYYNRPPLSNPVVGLYYESLQSFTLEQITAAISRHINSTAEAGKFFPKIADLRQQLESTKPSASEVIALARLANTPFGVMARAHIGSWDLSNADHWALVDRANEVLQMFDQFQDIAARGAYSSHLIEIMLKKNIPLDAPFLPGAVKPGAETVARIQQAARPVIEKQRNAERLAIACDMLEKEREQITGEQLKKNRERLAGIFGELSAAKVEPENSAQEIARRQAAERMQQALGMLAQ